MANRRPAKASKNGDVRFIPGGGAALAVSEPMKREAMRAGLMKESFTIFFISICFTI